MENNQIYIRKYKLSDKTYLRHICTETAWDDYKVNANKLEGVCIMYNDYFTEQEPEHIWVAVDKDDKPIGYVICTTDYIRYKQLMHEIYYPRLEKVSAEDISFFDSFLEVLDKVSDDYPTHFHIDILPEYQRMGIGHRLLNSLGNQLKTEGFNTLMLYSNSRSSIGYNFYIKYGFKEVYDFGDNAVALAYQL